MTELALAVFGGSEFTLGFELAGVRTTINTTGLDDQQCVELLFETMKRQDIGVLITSDESIRGLSSQDRTSIENHIRPVLIVLSEKEHDSGSLRRQIIKAIGVDVYEEK